MKTFVLTLIIGIAVTFLWRDNRDETFKFRNPFRTKPNLTKNLTPSGTMPGFGTGVKPKPGAVGGGGTDPWLKAGTIFGGLDLALMPLWFIPMGGGGDDTSGDGEAAGAAAQDPTSSISSSSSSSSSLLMLMMLVVLVLVAAT